MLPRRRVDSTRRGWIFCVSLVILAIFSTTLWRMVARRSPRQGPSSYRRGGVLPAPLLANVPLIPGRENDRTPAPTKMMMRELASSTATTNASSASSSFATVCALRTSLPIHDGDAVSEWTPALATQRARASLTPTVLDQLRKYNQKVEGKYRSGETTSNWKRYKDILESSVSSSSSGTLVKDCRTETPECTVFLDVRLKDNLTSSQDLLRLRGTDRSPNIPSSASHRRRLYPAEDGRREEEGDEWQNPFLYHKCCIEHRRLKSALGCLHQAIPSNCASPTVVAAVENESPPATAGAARRDETDCTWWAVFGTLLGIARTDSVIIPWDTDIDVMFEGSLPGRSATALEALAQQMSAGHVGKCRAKRLNLDHVHGTLVGYIYGHDADDADDEDEGGDGVKKAQTTAARGGRGGGGGGWHHRDDDPRIEVWSRQESKKTQRHHLIYPLAAHAVRLYGEVPVLLPVKTADILQAGYGAQWCRACKHRTSSCKNVSLG